MTAPQSKEFLTADHPDAHVDFPPLITNERGSAANEIPTDHVVCPKCQGWGGHNLMILAYNGPEGMPNTPEVRHKYRHFRCFCDQCYGWGHVHEANSHCVHTWGRHRNVGNCLNEYICASCGKIVTIDSSG